MNSYRRRINSLLNKSNFHQTNHFPVKCHFRLYFFLTKSKQQSMKRINIPEDDDDILEAFDKYGTNLSKKSR